uniref:Uncharacterized protein n=1 Tax=Candidatus Kentrum sp. LFY TaxID=2126342 RepID=A0A450U969_9GAMM|nr:MAG: hypothetical protein BECKLFY1418B_GA0070995_101117 [Candidatus Kentron sp. LFY]
MLNWKIHLKDNQDLASRLPKAMKRSYEYITNGIAKEKTELSKDSPVSCPWYFNKSINNDFLRN